MVLELRAVLPIDSMLLRFMPVAAEEEFCQLAGTEFKFKVAVEPTQVRMIGQRTVEQLKRFRTLPLSAVELYLTVECVGRLEVEITDRKHTSTTLAFGQNVLSAIECIHDSLVDFVRHDQGQWWVPSRPPRETNIDQHLAWYDTRFLGDADGEHGWVALQVTREPISATGTIREGISREAWDRWRTSLEEGRSLRIAPYKRMLANARAHLASFDFRAAIIEAVVAWEVFLSQRAPQLLAKRFSVNYSSENWSKLIARAQLSTSTELFLAFADISAPKLVGAIALRNEVVHRGARPNKDRSEEAVLAVATALRAADEADSAGPSMEGE